MKPNFLIAAEPYTHRSGGVMAKYDLCHELNRLGYPSAIAFFHSGSLAKQGWQWGISQEPKLYRPNSTWIKLDTTSPEAAIQEFLENGIVIYPEVILENPLGAKNVVRYVLAPSEVPWEGDYILTFSRLYREKYHRTLFQPFLDPAIHDRDCLPWYLRKMDATYIGKGDRFMPCHRIPGTILIERDWPRDKEQLGVLLRQVRYLFSWDDMTYTCTDAILSGCVPVLLSDSQIPKSKRAEGELGALPDIQLLNLMDPSSVTFDPAVVASQMTAFRGMVNYWANNWSDNVKAFAEDCCQHFNLS